MSHNLTKPFQRENTILNIFNTYINKITTRTKNGKIIKRFSNIKEFDVLSMPAFKIITDEMISKSSKGSIIMADINDLFVANKFRGKDKVNEMINNILSKIKHLLNDNQCLNYKIGKMGDEIYIYLPNNNAKESDIIVEKIHMISENELTISAGSSSNLSKGLINAIKDAEGKMSSNKNKFKGQRLKDICGENLNMIADSIIRTQFDKMRINLENMRYDNAYDLRNTFYKAIKELDIDAIVLNRNENENSTVYEEDYFYKSKKIYTEEAKLIYGTDTKSIDEYILANMLSRHSIDGVVNSEYFQGLGYNESYKKLNKEKAQNFDILVTDLSGIKTINDTLGHDEGDKAINDSLIFLRKIIQEKNIITYSDIIAKNGGNSYILIEKLNNERKNGLSDEIQKYGIDGNSGNLSILCSIQDVDRSNLNKSDFLNIINDTLNKAESTLELQSLSRKSNDVEQVKNSIKKMYQQIINLDDIQLLFKESKEQKEQIVETIKNRFETCIKIQIEKSNTSVDNNTCIKDLAAEKSYDLKECTDGRTI